MECVVRGYLAGSAWKEYRQHGTLAGEPLADGLMESDRPRSPIFSPATKAERPRREHHRRRRMREEVGAGAAARARAAGPLAIYERGRAIAGERGIIVADTKFEFGHSRGDRMLLVDEVLTPDSSRFWPADRYAPGRSQPSFDKQPLRD